MPGFSFNLAICCFGSFINIVAMTVLLPFLPAYIDGLGDYSQNEIFIWSSACYSVTFLAAAILAPLWGRLADRFGSKVNLIRASCGMCICMLLTAFAHSAGQLFLFRALVGLAGGYTSGAAILVAQQSQHKSGFSQGLLASSVLVGSLAGPALGGVLAAWLGFRQTILLTSACIFVNVIATLFLTGDRAALRPDDQAGSTPTLVRTPDGRMGLLLVAAGVVMIASVSIEPIIYSYIATLHPLTSTVAAAGLVLSAMALGSVISSAMLGHVADRIGYDRVLAASFLLSAILLAAHVAVSQAWQLAVLRFALGLSIGGALPCIRAQIKLVAEPRAIGRAIGWSTSAQYIGQVVGPVGAGLIAAYWDMAGVFYVSAAVALVFAVLFMRHARQGRTWQDDRQSLTAIDKRR